MHDDPLESLPRRPRVPDAANRDPFNGRDASARPERTERSGFRSWGDEVPNDSDGRRRNDNPSATICGQQHFYFIFDE